MIQELRPYAAYQESGQEWLGETPQHWTLGRLKNIVQQVNDQTGRSGEINSYVALEHVESWTGRIRPPDSEVTFESQVKRFKVGDVLFGKLRPYLAKVTRPETDGVCVGEFLVLRPEPFKLSPAFLEQLLRSKPVSMS